jgi:hypothetical protein
MITGSTLASASGLYRASISASCRFAISLGTRVLWATPNRGVSGGCPTGFVEIEANGTLALFSSTSAPVPVWTDATTPGASGSLKLAANGQLEVLTKGNVVAWWSGSGPTGNANNTLVEGQVLLLGQSIYSTNGAYVAELGIDGDFLVAHTAGGKLVWASGTAGTGSTMVQIRATDSSILVLDPKLAAHWASGTAGLIGSRLTLGNQGLLSYWGTVGQLWNSSVARTGVVTWHMPSSVGVYAYGSSSDAACAFYSQPICDAWPIIGITGGLGTPGSPWVDTSSNADFDAGVAIADSGRWSIPWLSFWTVSGPGCGSGPFAEAVTGVVAGEAVAHKIDRYASAGLGLKPTYVILDPEGYPDDHSGLDCHSGARGSVSSGDVTNFKEMLAGWIDGLDSVDPSLKGGFYADMSEYASYQLGSAHADAAQGGGLIPAFLAVAFGYSGNNASPLVDPAPISSAIPYGASAVAGSNLEGIIAFYAGVPFPQECGWNSVAAQVLANWGTRLNTLQFDPGTTCSA